MTINNDTVYSMAQLDLSVGPVALTCPTPAGRYYVLQFVDAWTNNFAYVGHRATGTGEGDFLLVPPGWDGAPPDGATVIRFPTTVASIVGRWAVASDDDLPVVHALQDATTLTRSMPPRWRWSCGARPGVPDELVFLEKLRIWSQQFPPADRDRPLQDSLAPLGITQPAPRRTRDLRRRAAASSPQGSRPRRRRCTRHSCRVTAPRSTAGSSPSTPSTTTSTSSRWARSTTTGSRSPTELRIVERAAAAIGGLWGNHPYEAAYIMTYLDDRGEHLNGAHTYTLRLHPTPPVNAFWSLTMYSVPDFYLVDNPINRYSIGDRTPGVILDDDGALTITISHERPTGDEGSRQLAAQPRRRLPTRPAHVRTRAAILDRLRVPRHHPSLMSQSAAKP